MPAFRHHETGRLTACARVFCRRWRTIEIMNRYGSVTETLIHQQGIICCIAFDRSSLRRKKFRGQRYKALGLRVNDNIRYHSFSLAPRALRPTPHSYALSLLGAPALKRDFARSRKWGPTQSEGSPRKTWKIYRSKVYVLLTSQPLKRHHPRHVLRSYETRVVMEVP